MVGDKDDLLLIKFSFRILFYGSFKRSLEIYVFLCLLSIFFARKSAMNSHIFRSLPSFVG